MRGGEKIKEKFFRLFICLIVAAMGPGMAIGVASAADAEYSDYYITGGKVVSNDTGIRYQITKSDNTTSIKWTRGITTAGAVGIQRYTVIAQSNRTGYALNAINKYTGNNRWSMSLDQAYTRLQFIGGKYAVVMNQNKFLQINLYTHRIVTGKTFEAAANEFFGLIKSKKNGNYYVMTITDGIAKFFKLNPN